MRWQCRLTAGLLGLAVLPLLGCGGGGGGAAGPSGPTTEQALNDLGQMLQWVAQEKKRVPSKLTEMDEYEPLFMSAALGVRTGEVVYYWSAGYKPDSAAVVAHEKGADAHGGLVLLQDGSVKRMTADELNAAPKAGKK